jgi:hypothetical protein
MAMITGMGTTYDLPNYSGLILQLTPADTPLLAAIGGLTGGRQSESTEFEWETFDLRDPGQNVRVEGADAPTAEERVRSNVTNITQIHQESVSISYSKWAATGQKAGSNNAQPNPVGNEVDWQIEQMLKQMARDAEWSFLNGTYDKPADNTSPRKTRGLLEAITTNVIAAPTPSTGGDENALSTDMIDQLVADVYDSGGVMESGTATLIVSSRQKRALTRVYATAGNYRETSRNVGGLDLQTIETDFMTLNVMLDRHMPADTVLLASLEQVTPVFLEVPGKGHFFSEPLAHTGASVKVQLYGELGLAYGNERAHGKLTGLATG